VPHYNVMGVAKAALEASTRYLAADLGPSGIRVNAISAGPVRTLSAHGIAGFRTMYGSFAEVTPLRSHITIEDVGGTAVYLASSLSGQDDGRDDLRPTAASTSWACPSPNRPGRFHRPQPRPSRRLSSPAVATQLRARDEQKASSGPTANGLAKAPITSRVTIRDQAARGTTVNCRGQPDAQPHDAPPRIHSR